MVRSQRMVLGQNIVLRNECGVQIVHGIEVMFVVQVSLDNVLFRALGNHFFIEFVVDYCVSLNFTFVQDRITFRS